MKSQINDLLARVLSRWVDWVREHAGAVLLGVSIATLLFGVYAAFNLGVNADNVKLMRDDLPFRRHHIEFAKVFPNLDNALLVVVDGATPELARTSANALAAKLAAEIDVFQDAYVPGGDPFFQRYGLLYRDVDELDDFVTHMAGVQPIVAELERDSSIENLAMLVRHGLDEVQSQNGDGAEWAGILDRVGHASVSIYAEYPLAISWEEVLLEGSALEVSTRRVIVLHPNLDFSSLLAAGRALGVVRDAARELGLQPERGVVVRVTGNPALNFEEMVGIAWDVGIAGVFCFLLVAGLLYLAFRSLPLVIAAVVTLLVGLVWTAAFAAVAIGHLNLVSIAFGILFIGLGVDFSIHLGMRYADVLSERHSHAEALRGAASGVGASLVLCSITTAIGFYVFVPTDFRGVAELGLIAGTGMIVIVFLTLTLFPALLSTRLRVDPAGARHSLTFQNQWWSAAERHPRVVRWTAAALGVCAAFLAPHARFSAQVVDMRDPTTESVQAFNDLLDQKGMESPWLINVLADNLQEAGELAQRLRELDTVARAVTLTDFVPADQGDKLDTLEMLDMMLEAPPPSDAPRESTSSAEQIEALRDLYVFLDADWIAEQDSMLARSMTNLHDRLASLLLRLDREGDPEEALQTLERILLANLPAQLDRLRDAVSVGEIDIDDLPDSLVDRMVAEDGRARVQVFPAENLQDVDALERFGDSVSEISPSATGVSINIVELGRSTVRSFRQAVLSAFIAITLLLLLLWRRISDTLLVLTPLVLAALLTMASMVVLGVEFNFANIIVLPLLFGIGVDSGIHLVAETRHPSGRGELLATTTARAVFYSAATTTLSFGSLAFSDHRGMSSLGVLLVVGMIITLACNLIVLPSLLALRTASD